MMIIAVVSSFRHAEHMRIYISLCMYCIMNARASFKFQVARGPLALAGRVSDPLHEQE